MKLYKNSDNEFTLRTHDQRLYKLTRQGDHILTQYIGRVSSNAVITGFLLKSIPNFLKHKCFTLNKKPNGTQ